MLWQLVKHNDMDNIRLIVVGGPSIMVWGGVALNQNVGPGQGKWTLFGVTAFWFIDKVCEPIFSHIFNRTMAMPTQSE